jgi:uncharacterized protein (TIGR02145 family)
MKQIITFILFVLITSIVQAQQPSKVKAEVGPTAEELKRQKELETLIAKQGKLSDLMRENNISAPSLMGFATSDKEVINRIIKTNQDLINKINGISGLKSLSMEVHTMSKTLGHKTSLSTDYITYILEKANENIRRGRARLAELENEKVVINENQWGFEGLVEDNKISTIKKDSIVDKTVFTDPRDGKTYNTVVVGGKKWIAENLAYKPQNGTFWVYNNNQSNVSNHGYLYDWYTAQNVCPQGWNLPKLEDWSALASISIEQVKSVSGWKQNNGTNESGFNAKASGVWFYIPGFEKFSGLGEITYWWTSTEGQNREKAYFIVLSSESRKIGQTIDTKKHGFSVRCVCEIK